VEADAQTRIAEPDRLKGIKTIGVDEHIWRPSKITSTDKAVTVMVDLTRDEHGCLQAQLLDAAQGRSGKVYADWLTEHGVDAKVTAGRPCGHAGAGLLSPHRPATRTARQVPADR
jgi:transposase